MDDDVSDMVVTTLPPKYKEMRALTDKATAKNYSTLLMGKTNGRRALYRNQEDSADSTVYKAYPKNKPFINDDYERPPYKPVYSYPEGNRRAVITALKNLQGKIQKLELERTAAEDNLKCLTTETNKYRDILQKEQEKPEPRQTVVSRQNQELESQLNAAETRCDLLEKQLDYMRTMVHSAEKDRSEALTKSVQIEQPPEPEASSEFLSRLRKISDLEREHIKLTANQSLAESKIRELEEKLGEERHHRQRMVEKTVEIEAYDNANRILKEAEIESRSQPKAKRPMKKKKRAVVSKKNGHCSKPDPSKHYRLNLADIPFVAGKNTGPSHSVGANVQKVFSLMKTHNMALCASASNPLSPGQPDSASSGSSNTSPTTERDLADILLQLQDEFHQMSFEHQELSKEISVASDFRVREDLERELDALVSRMEAKSQQISKIRRHQEKISDKKKKKKSKKKQEDFERPHSAMASYDNTKIRSSPRHSGEVEVTTTIKTKGPGSGVVTVRPSSAREISLNVLKDMKKLQTTLRKDDLSWD